MRVTLKDVAELAGVSQGTASKVLNRKGQSSPATERRVLDAAAKLGYQARHARQKADRGKIVIFTELAHQGQMQAVLKTMASLTSDYGFDHQILYSGNGAELASRIDWQPLDGAIFYGCPVNRKLAEALYNRGVPFVFLDSYLEDLPVFSVVSADADGAKMAVNHLIGLGHERIAFVSPGLKGHTYFEDRQRGYIESMATHGLPVGPTVVFGQGDPPAEPQSALYNLLTSSDRPTAIFCASDNVAALALKTANELGLKVPRDLSIVGFDDDPWCATLVPGLTTVRIHLNEMSRQAVRILARAIKEPERLSVPVRVVVHVDLITRDSCAPPATRT